MDQMRRWASNLFEAFSELIFQSDTLAFLIFHNSYRSLVESSVRIEPQLLHSSDHPQHLKNVYSLTLGKASVSLEQYCSIFLSVFLRRDSFLKFTSYRYNLPEL